MLREEGSAVVAETTIARPEHLDVRGPGRGKA